MKKVRLLAGGMIFLAALLMVSIPLFAIPPTIVNPNTKLITVKPDSKDEIIQLVEELGGKIVYDYETFNMIAAYFPPEKLADAVATLEENENVLQISSDVGIRRVPPPPSDTGEGGGPGAGAEEVATGGDWWYDRIDAEEILRNGITGALIPLSSRQKTPATAKMPFVIMGGIGAFGLLGAGLARWRGLRNLFLGLLVISISLIAAGCGGIVFRTIATGEGVRVAIIDTGIDKTNPDLDSNVAGGVTFLDGLNAYVGGTLQQDCGWSTYPPSPFDDEIGHGSMVAGFVAAENNRQGIIGVAPKASLYAVRIFDCGYYGFAVTSDIIAAIDWARTNRMHIINESIGTIPLPRECNPEEYPDASGCSAIVDPIFGPGAGAAIYADFAAEIAATNAAVAAGVTVVVAAGNDSVDLGKPSSYCSWDVFGDGSLIIDWLALGSEGCFVGPASYSKVISVGASSWNDIISGFSNYGADVDIFAPGSTVTSTCSTVAYWTGSPFWRYCKGSGTSFASPIVAGVAAVLRQPGACPYGATTPAAIKARLQATAEHPGIYFDTGITPVPQGLVDAENACLGTTNGDNWKMGP
jgi:subtilisin family serine protease